MEIPIQFPDPHTERQKRVDEFQRLSPEARWRELAALMAFGWRTVKSSPHREAIEKQMAEHELRWRQVQQELFARHGQ